jgi:hypothetical protein
MSFQERPDATFITRPFVRVSLAMVRARLSA